jgi:adenosylhomocysteinase
MENETKDYKVKDISLHEWGRKELDIAEHEMPGLMATRAKYGEAQPFKGKKISGSLHMTIQTAVLIETLEALGGDIRWCSCNIYSTQDHAASAIAQSGTANVFAWKNMTCKEYWWCTLQALTFPDGSGPDSIVDDGGDMTLMLIEGMKWEKKYKEEKKLPNPDDVEAEDEKALYEFFREYIPQDPDRFARLSENVKGVSEETTTGVHRLYDLSKKKQLPFVAINVNDSVTKSKFDNVYGCRHSVIDGVLRATDVLISGKKVMVCGYGDVGKGCAQAFRDQHAVVYVSEIDPICALQACMEGFQVKKIETVVSEVDIFITATGNKNIITVQHMEQMKHNAIVGNIGHFDNEIDMAGLKNYPGIKKIEIKPQTDKWVFPDGHCVIVLADGRLLNLGCATGHPSFVMSNSFTNQTLAQISIHDPENNYEAGQVYLLPKKLDEEVARLHLEAFGAELTEMSADQAEYINLDVKGPYKPETYRY